MFDVASRSPHPAHRAAAATAGHRRQERPAARVPCPQDAARGRQRLADAMREVKDRVTYCTVCSNITDTDRCFYCTHPSRDHRLIGVVEKPENVSAIEKTRDFKGIYRVPHGGVSPLHGVGPDDLKIRGLCSRASAAVASRKSSSRPIPTSKAKRPRSTSPSSSSPSGCASRASPWACPSAATSTTPTK